MSVDNLTEMLIRNDDSQFKKEVRLEILSDNNIKDGTKESTKSPGVSNSTNDSTSHISNHVSNHINCVIAGMANMICFIAYTLGSIYFKEGFVVLRGPSIVIITVIISFDLSEKSFLHESDFKKSLRHGTTYVLLLSCEIVLFDWMFDHGTCYVFIIKSVLSFILYVFLNIISKSKYRRSLQMNFVMLAAVIMFICALMFILYLFANNLISDYAMSWYAQVFYSALFIVSLSELNLSTNMFGNQLFILEEDKKNMAQFQIKVYSAMLYIMIVAVLVSLSASR
jgi:hypothetical protein